MPDTDVHSLWTAKVGRSGRLKLVQDVELHARVDGLPPPMPWDPVWIDVIASALSGGPDMPAIHDSVL